MSPPGGDACQVETPWQPERFSTTDIRLPPQGSEVAMQLLAAEEHIYNSHALKYLRDRTRYLHEDAYFADRGGCAEQTTQLIVQDGRIVAILRITNSFTPRLRASLVGLQN